MTYNQLTIDEINNILKEKQLKVLDDYTNTKNKATFQCLICGNTFTNKYDNVRYRKDSGCLNCRKVFSYNKTSEEKVKYRLLKIKKNIKDNVEFVDFLDETYDKVLVKCLICGETYTTSYNSIINGHGHRSCNVKIGSLKQMASIDDICKKLKQYDNDFYVDFSNYNNSPDELFCKCNICGYEWYAKRRNLLRDRGCPNCSQQKRNISKVIPFDECSSILDELHLELISGYSGSSSDIIVKCMECNYIFKTTISYLKNFQIGCIECNKKNRTQSKMEDFLKKMIKLNSQLIMIGDYTSMSDETLFKCLDCGYEFYKTPHDIQKSFSCPSCTTNSKMEYLVQSYLNKNCFKYEIHKDFEGLLGIKNGKLSYDFYLPSYNLLIECQGKQHYEPIDYFGGIEQFKIQQEHDRRKRQYALTNNINLIEIPYWDECNISQILDEHFKNGTNLQSVIN